MTKSKVLVLALLVSSYARITYAQSAPEAYKFSSGLAIIKCVPGSDGNLNCQQAGGDTVSHDITVTLDTCNQESDGSTTCTGDWNGTQSADGYSFSGDISVTKYTDTGGGVSYTITASLTHPTATTSSSMNLSPGSGARLTDSGILAGDLWQTADGKATYIPVIDIAASGNSTSLSASVRTAAQHRLLRR